MPPATSTPNQRLAERILQRPLNEYVSEKRDAIPKWSWGLIAEQLSTDTDGEVAISGEALRLWFRDDMAAAS